MKTIRLSKKSPNRGVSAILLIHCIDKEGIVAAVSKFISDHNGNIIHLNQHVDSSLGIFFMRVEWTMGNFNVPRDLIFKAFKSEVSTRFKMNIQLFFSDQRIRTAIFVSKEQHCLMDLFSRDKTDRWPWDLRLVISNHADMEEEVARRHIRFVHIPTSIKGRRKAEQKHIKALQLENIELVVLARYMQILSPFFCKQYPNQIINIHHSFLPAFPGAKPYHSAFDRGVKIIGATSHFVTSKLDEGPIIDQDTARVSHEDGVQDMIRKGRDLERVVLARAIWQYLQRRVLVYRHKTINFM